ncbi:hypothetical protein H5410_004344 [Solanum commersonii]|uniref:Uncharacterized protein n=1 Tax=Solanum commersonii TaxID=4109 RepID=A0A9J6B7Q1_SOLCO|nr:hypothetical protein H5410_004344 [Solanum commersonii]
MADNNTTTQDYDGSSQTISTGNKYGGLAPKKKPLISKASFMLYFSLKKSSFHLKTNLLIYIMLLIQDHERAFFDSADWALCKQGAGVDQKSTVAIETLRPKLQRTAHQQLPPRRPACTS